MSALLKFKSDKTKVTQTKKIQHYYTQIHYYIYLYTHNRRYKSMHIHIVNLIYNFIKYIDVY